MGTRAFKEVSAWALGLSRRLQSELRSFKDVGNDAIMQEVVNSTVYLLQEQRAFQIPSKVHGLLQEYFRHHEQRTAQRQDEYTQTLVSLFVEILDRFRHHAGTTIFYGAMEALARESDNQDPGNKNFMSAFLELLMERAREGSRPGDPDYMVACAPELPSGCKKTEENSALLQADLVSQISLLEKEVSRLMVTTKDLRAENRQLYNQVQDLKGNIRVYCRIRPPTSDTEGHPVVSESNDGGSVVLSNPVKPGAFKDFAFDRVFGADSSQDNVFSDIQPLIRSVLDGYNVCIFAYGQTGSGKTYTMSGPSKGGESEWGVNPRALHDLFRLSDERRGLISYEISVQMLEIYNEQVRDLLVTDGSHPKLDIKANPQSGGMAVPGARAAKVTSPSEVAKLIISGRSNRAVGATAMNEQSSRSHSIVTVHAEGVEAASRTRLRGQLHLVDLAGSERVARSEAQGARLKEAQHINRSLSALGDVIAALVEKSPHVPYRNSKLTQLLQSSLGGRAKMLMFVHVSPETASYSETLSTLQFASRVSKVELGAAAKSREVGPLSCVTNVAPHLSPAPQLSPATSGTASPAQRIPGKAGQVRPPAGGLARKGVAAKQWL